MQVYRTVNEMNFESNSFLTIGTFDGIHLGHQEIIKELVQRASENRGRSALITFYPHPQTIVHTYKTDIEILTPLEEKIQILEDHGLDSVLVIPFDEKISRLKPDDFVKNILVKNIGVKDIIIGFNHAFGYQRKGNMDLLQEMANEFHFSVDLVPPVEINGETVSSTKIRELLKNGNVEKANLFLGRHYSISGIVTTGKGLGRELGFPTANITVKGNQKLIPGNGVYAVVVQIPSKTYIGMTNIGLKPTLGGTNRQIEVHLNDFSGDLYDMEITIEFVHRIRNEIEFDSIEALKQQIIKDHKFTKQLMRNHIRR